MRWQYSHLNETPYLYPSKELRNMYWGSNGKKETNKRNCGSHGKT